MRKPLIHAVLLGGSIVLFFFTVGRGEAGWQGLHEVSKILFGAGFAYFLVLLIENFHLIRAYATLLLKWQLHKEIRFSYSYLFRIQVKDERQRSRFLLVRNDKRDYRTFQPPGGVYKVFDLGDLNRVGVRDADKLHEDRDVRIKFRGYKLARILQYIAESSNIELDHGREFWEEIFDTNILPQSLFPYLNLKKWGQSNTGIRYSKYLKTYEYNVYDIIDLELTPDQDSAVQSLLHKPIYGERYVLATASIIEACGMDEELNRDVYNVTEHTCRIIKL